jgi:hypothetical protein
MSWKTILAGFHYIGREKLILGSISLNLFAVLLGGAVALFSSMPRKFWIPGLGGWEFFAVLRLRVLRPWQFSSRTSLWGAGRIDDALVRGRIRRRHHTFRTFPKPGAFPVRALFRRRDGHG